MWHLPNNIRAHKYVPEICQRTDQLASLDAKQTESVTDFLHFEKTQSLAYFMLLLSKTSLIATVTKMIYFVDFSKHVGAVF